MAEEEDLQLKVDLLEKIANSLGRKLRKMEATLEVEEAKKHAILDKLLTVEGYWSAPPSSHDGSNSNSGDEKGEKGDPEPATQTPAAGKRKAPEQPVPLLGKGSPHQQLLMMQQPRAHKPGGAGGKAKVEEEELIASLTNAAMFG